MRLSTVPILRAGFCVAGTLLVAPAWAQGAEPLFRYQAPIAVERAAPFIELELTATAAMRSQRGDLSDLRIVDAQGRRAPFAWLPPETRSAPEARLADVSYFALPARGTRQNDLPAELEVVSTPHTLVVRKRSGGAAPAPKAPVPGWLVDLGPAAVDPKTPALDSLQLRWPAGTHFTANYRLESSTDLRSWQPAGSGTVMALEAGSLRIAQAAIPLPSARTRFYRWTWDDPASVPAPNRIQAREVQANPSLDRALETLTVPLAPAPRPATGEAAPPAGALEADLGGILPLHSLRLVLPAGTQVLPVRLQRRERATEPWAEAGSTVFYRFDRDGLTSEPPPFEMRGRARYLRVVPDSRVSVPDVAALRLSAAVERPRLVWAQQGTPPFQLQVGAADADSGALPLVTLVPGGEAERAQFGRSSLGPLTESPRAAEKAERDAWLSTGRPALLWGVLVLGVSGLGFMIWRLARGAPAATRPPRPQ